MPGFVIRAATPADRASLEEQAQLLNIHEHRFEPDRRTDRAGGALAIDELQRRVAEEGGAMCVAESGGVVVGHVVVWFGRLPPFVREELRDYAYLGDLFVRAAYRSQGIGAALAAQAERIARARGVPRIMLGVIAGNPAETLYRRLGYRTYAHDLIKDLR